MAFNFFTAKEFTPISPMWPGSLPVHPKGQCKDRGGCATLRVSSTLIARWNAGC